MCAKRLVGPLLPRNRLIEYISQLTFPDWFYAQPGADRRSCATREAVSGERGLSARSTDGRPYPAEAGKFFLRGEAFHSACTRFGLVAS